MAQAFGKEWLASGSHIGELPCFRHYGMSFDEVFLPLRQHWDDNAGTASLLFHCINGRSRSPVINRGKGRATLSTRTPPPFRREEHVDGCGLVKSRCGVQWKVRAQGKVR